MIPVLWMLTMLGPSLSRHTPPFPAFDATLSPKSLPQEQKENTTHSSTIGKPSESATFSSSMNGGSVNTPKIHDVKSASPEAISESEARKSTQTYDQWPPPKQSSELLQTTPTHMQKAPRNVSRDPRKLAKDVYTKLAASDDVVSVPVRGKAPKSETGKLEKNNGDDGVLEKNYNSTSDIYSGGPGDLVTPNNEDSVIAGNNVLVTSIQQSLVGNYRDSMPDRNSSTQNLILVDHPVTANDSITDVTVKHGEGLFLLDDHLVQKLSPQVEDDHQTSVSLEVYENSPTQKGETEAMSNFSKSETEQLREPNLEKNHPNDSLINLNSNVVISTVGEDVRHEGIPVFSITNEMSSFTVPEEKTSSTGSSAPKSSSDEGLRVTPIMLSAKDVLPTTSYDVRYVDIENETTLASESSSTPMPSKIQDSATVPPLQHNETRSAMEKWKDLEKQIRAQTSSLVKKMLPKVLEHSGRWNVSSGCTAAMIQFIIGLRSLKSWAVKMLDASGKIPTGVLEGTMTDFGDYDECLNIQKPSKQRDKVTGKYCAVQLRPVLPPLTRSVTIQSKVLDFGNSSRDTVFSDISDASALFHVLQLRIGLCVPSLCSGYDIDQLISMVFHGLPLEVSVPWCEVKQLIKFSTTQIVIISVMALIGLIVCVGTATDVFIKRWSTEGLELGRLKKSLCAFSLVSNVKQLLQNSTRSSQLEAVNGIRCLSLAWIILAHTYGFGHRQGLARLTDAKHYMEDIAFQIITNGWLSVDTFFLLGGLLAANSILKTIERRDSKISFIPHVLHRLWRLTPPVVAVVGIMFLLPLIGSGPLWPDMVGRKVANCEQRWWQAILPINSWLDFDSTCLLHTWYISADVQFYCLAPIALFLLYKWPTLGYIVLFLATSLCSLVTGLLTVLYYLPPTIIFFSPNIEMTKKTANLVYFRPYPHMGAYCVGLALGYILWKHQKITINWMLQVLGWGMSITSSLAVLLATYSWSRGQMPNPVVGVIYAVLHRTVWAAGIAWVLLMCATKRADVLNNFLSWNFFTPLSRLCYSVYLLHFPVLWVRVSWRRTLLNFYHYDIVIEFFGILAITLCLSVFFYLVFEVPFLNLENIWFPRSHQKTKKNMEVKQTD